MNNSFSGASKHNNPQGININNNNNNIDDDSVILLQDMADSIQIRGQEEEQRSEDSFFD